MISDLILCHKVRKLFAIINHTKRRNPVPNLQEDQIYSFYRKTNLSYKLFENFSISHRIITFGKHTYPLYEQKTSICAVVHITRMDEL